MIQNTWSDLKGEALEHYNFQFDGDPRTQWPISVGRVGDESLISIVQYYKFEPEKLPCGLCGSAKHNKGAVVLLNDRKFCLVGNNCGARFFGEDWAIQRNALSSAEKKANYRKKARSILEKKVDIEVALKQLRKPIDQFESERKSLKSAFSRDFHRISVELFRSSGRLSYTVGTSNTTRDQGGRGSLAHINKDTDQITGWGIFSINDQRQSLERNIRRIVSGLTDLEGDYEKDFSLHGKVRAIKSGIDDIISLINIYNSSIDWSAPHNAQTIDFWFQMTNSSSRVINAENGWSVQTGLKPRCISSSVRKKIAIPSIFTDILILA